MQGWARCALGSFLPVSAAASILFSALPATAQIGGQTSSTLLAAGRLYEIVIPAADYEGCALRASFLPSAANGYHVLELGEYLGGLPVAARSYLVDGADSTTTLDLRLGPLSSDRSSHCLQAPLPTVVERGRTSDALAEIALSGELGRTHVLSGLKVGDLVYLRDISRRQSSSGHPLGNAGRMAERAAVETLVHRASLAFAGGDSLRKDLTAVSSSALAFTEAELESAAAAHINAGMTYDALLTLGLNGHDGRGGSIFSIVAQPFPPSDIPNSCSGGVIAAGSSFNAVAFGNFLAYSPPGEYGSFRHFNSYASLLDIVAHEYTHAITGNASGLAYRGESGALDEGFADWMGVAVQAVASGQVDWRIGEGRLVEEISSGAKGELFELRNLRDPERLGDPKRVGGKFWQNPNCESPRLCNDYCGVHTNSGVANHAFYLMVEGAAETSTIGGSAIPPFAGMGITAAIKLGLYANLNLWSSDETLASAADDMILAAAQIHGADAPQVEAVSCAWISVGVSHSGDCNFIDGTPEPPRPDGTPEPPRPDGTPEPPRPDGTPEPPRPDGTPEPLGPDGTPEPPRPDGTPEPPRPDGTPEPPRPDGTPEPPRPDGTPEPPRPDGTPEPPRPDGTPEPLGPDDSSIRDGSPSTGALARSTLVWLALLLFGQDFCRGLRRTLVPLTRALNQPDLD